MTAAPLIGMAVFAALLIFDHYTHKKTKLGRSVPDWIFLCVFIFGLVFSAASLLVPLLNAGKASDVDRYVAYRYLMDGESAYARKTVIQGLREDTEGDELIEIFSYAVEGNYEEAYFRADEYIGKSSLTIDESEAASKILEIAKAALADGSDVSAEVSALVEEAYASLKIEETEELRDYYELHKAVSAGEGVEKALVEQMLEAFPDEPSVKKTAVTFYVSQSMFEEAEAYAKELLEDDKTASDQIIYTDVIAMWAWTASVSDLKESGNFEIVSYVEKAEEAAEKAASDEKKYDSYMRSFDEYLEKAREEMLVRIENYIRVKSPGDSTGLYDLQLIKMDLLTGEYDSALSIFEDLLEGLTDIGSDSPVYSELINISADTENYTAADETSKDEIFNVLAEDIRELFEIQSQAVSGCGEDGINTYAANMLSSLLKYSKPAIVITDIDTSSYPKLNVSFQMNISRENVFGRNGEFYRDDFSVTDTGLDFDWDDFTLSASVGSGDTAVCVVVDINSSSSEMKSAVSDALLNLIDGTRVRAVVASDGSVLCGFGDEYGYYTAVRELDLETEGDSHTALMTGIGLFKSRSNDAECLLWITDKEEFESSSGQEIIDAAAAEGITVYIIYTGEDDETLYGSLVLSSLGTVFELEKPFEMTACVREITELLDNRYEITYKVANESAMKRSVTVGIPDRNLSGSEGYTQEEES